MSDPLGAYPSPEQARAEVRDLAARFEHLAQLEVIGESTQRRPIQALRLHGAGQQRDGGRPRLLITAHIHAIEYVGSYVARAVARRLAEGYGAQPHITELLDRADVWIVPLLNPDGAERIWRNRGWTGLGGSRFTANGVDPNRNFPFVESGGRKSWNSARTKPGSAYYRGPHPFSEPECLALARLCARERFCAAVNFHSFSAVVFLPEVADLPAIRDTTRHKAEYVLGVFQGVFQQHQPYRRYRPVAERAAAITGQLDPFLLQAFGTPSVTIEVSRPKADILLPWRLLHFFDWANPADPEYWAGNDVDATVFALSELLQRSGGTACEPSQPQLGVLP
ncbi:MAG TPA: M14 family zinc carboxypeptidase [Terriglobales bacterium]|nr:M14 family zinc carboxypeptidase [Terriglobales bacterium]